MRARALLPIIAASAIAAAQACSGSSDSAEPGGADADIDVTTASDASSADSGGLVERDVVTDDVTSVDVVDALEPLDANDAGIDAADAENANDASDASDAPDVSDSPDADATDASDASDDAADAGPPTPELVSPAYCPWAIAIAGDHVFWTENASGGCLPAVRTCSTTNKCSTLPAALYAGTGGQSLPMGIAAVSASGPVFYADGQVPNDYLWRLELGGARTIWSASAVGAAAATTDGTFVYFGSSDGLTRVDVADAGAKLLFSGNMSGTVQNGPQTIALDGTRAYGAADTNHVRACVLAGNCNDGGAVDLGADVIDGGVAQSVGAVVSDGTNVFFTSGLRYDQSGTGPERLLRCPVTGCPGGIPQVVYERVTTKTTVNGSHLGIAVDATHVFFGTDAGTIEMCPKTALNGAGCTTFLTGVRPFGFATDGPYLYWADWSAGIYRIRRP